METTKSTDKRILSVDVLRGFDMFWLIGGTGLALAITKLFGPGIQNLLIPQFDHAEWIGFTFYDLIFPLFEFVMGMSVVFSLKKILQQEGKIAAYEAELFHRIELAKQTVQMIDVLREKLRHQHAI